MKKLMIFAAGLVALALFADSVRQRDDAIRIMLVGDSITHGSHSTTGNGYRAPLWCALTNLGYRVDFVGTQTDSYGRFDPLLGDLDHEGISGITIGGMLKRIDGVFDKCGPVDCVLLHLGTNDSLKGRDKFVNEATNMLVKLLDRIHKRSPGAEVVVTTLMPRWTEPKVGDEASNWKYAAITNVFNPAVPGIVASQRAKGQHTHFLDMHAVIGFGQLADEVHPNDSGYAMMANAWLGVFTNIFPRPAATATFVSPQGKPPADGAAAVFEKRFENRGSIRRATWNVTAQGVFEVFANGRRVGDDFLKPGATECGKCRHVYSYDVTDRLDCRAGAKNVLSATVTPGWWCDQMMRLPAQKPEWQLGKEIAFRGEMRLEFDDGSVQAIGTDESWLAAYTGPVVSAGIYEGEVYDARRNAEGLKPVRRNTEFSGELRPASAKVTLREDLVLRPSDIYVVKGAEGASQDAFGVAKVVRRCKDGENVRLEPGEMLVVDFGQNCSAVPSFDVTGEAGTELEIRTSEMLNESHGEKSRGNDGPAGTPYLASLREAYAGIRYTLKDGAQSYMPRYTYFGYRYIGVTATKAVEFSSWRSVPVSSVTKKMERGSIVTGNAKVNRLIGNIRWGMLSNYLSSPTDCPQRDERLGWTADTQVFMDSAAYLADTREFLGKFLADLRDAQSTNGCYKCFVPNVRHVFATWASAGWTDAGVIIPYRLWKWYGDRKVIDESWDSMVRYMDFLENNKEPYRINHGDWLAFEHHIKLENNLSGDAMDKRQVKALNAYFRVWMAMLMREMAEATGRGEAVRHYADEETKLRKAFADAYVGPDGTIKDEYKGQCNDLYMLKLGLCGNPAAVEATKRDLIDNIKSHGDRLQTGFLGTAILLPTLTFEANAPELAYSLLLQEAFPSWLYSVKQGATTIWERWNGYTKEKGYGPVGMNSFNHYAYGCVLEWLFSAVAGIRPDPELGGWRRFRLRPYPDRRLGSCSATYRSDFGEIRSAWRYDDTGRLVWRFSIPAGSTALVTGLDGSTREYAAGDYELKY